MLYALLGVIFLPLRPRLHRCLPQIPQELADLARHGGGFLGGKGVHLAHGIAHHFFQHLSCIHPGVAVSRRVEPDHLPDLRGAVLLLKLPYRRAQIDLPVLDLLVRRLMPRDYQRVKNRLASGVRTTMMTEKVSDSTEVRVARCWEGNMLCSSALVRTCRASSPTAARKPPNVISW